MWLNGGYLFQPFPGEYTYDNIQILDAGRPFYFVVCIMLLRMVFLRVCILLKYGNDSPVHDRMPSERESNGEMSDYGNTLNGDQHFAHRTIRNRVVYY